MKKLFCILGVTMLLAACATQSAKSPVEQQDAIACRRTDAPTGSNLVRKSECAPSAQAATPADTKKN
ncbi:hypothetical protein [Caenimonas koreensis]|uniref:hypothetical protein n=1 Tax=Caenimonas koreensis TaxID=367474 RepID=UPI00378318FD